jgi:GTP-binding protein
MKMMKADFLRGVTKAEEFPELLLPEIAFSGRSNVGKSSLINSLVMRKNLAHISSTPGKTQQINFYSVAEKWSFADLPGFGYAVASKDKRHSWSKLNYEYLEKRENLKLVCVLIDSRHDPMDSDLALIEWLENIGRSYIIILTKCDKINKKMVEERKNQIEQLTINCKYYHETLPYSIIDNTGRDSLLGIIKKFSVIKM